MYRTFLSKTNYCKYLQCPKMLWLKKHRPKLAVRAAKPGVFETGHRVGRIAQDLFGKQHYDIHYQGDMNNMIDLTSQYLVDRPNIITEATFSYDNNFCMVDILKNDYDGMEIYEVKSSTGVTDVYIDDASFQYYVISNLGFKVKKVCIIHINGQYVRKKELDLDELFTIEDITDIALEKQDEIRDNIDKINEFMSEHDRKNEPCIDIGMHCTNPYRCDFWQYCTRHLPKPNVFDVRNMDEKTKFEKYGEGIVSFIDLLNDELTPKQLEQVDFEVNNRNAKIDKQAIVEVLDSLQYPLYFLDYETVMMAVPEIENTRPYNPALPFQYSLHVMESEESELEHREFLAHRDDKDFVRHFAESLISDIPAGGSVIVYSKYEHTINKRIAELYPEYRDDLERINDSIVDFMEVFEKRSYYTRKMRGSYSLKEVLPALYPGEDELDYDNLKIVHDGDEASASFLTLDVKSPDEVDKIREALLEYCKLDTYALVKIYEKFREITDN